MGERPVVGFILQCGMNALESFTPNLYPFAQQNNLEAS